MYDILLKCVYLAIHLIPNKKYKKWLSTQKQIFNQFIPNTKKVIWVHCASLGEYEQIKPFIPKLKEINSLINITFFSPSGYNNFHDFNLITQKSYLPLDTKKNMTSFIKMINPMMVIIAQNDVWPNMVTHLDNNKIPLYLMGTKLNRKKINNFFLKKYYKKYLSKAAHIFCQNKLTFHFIKEEKITNCSIIGNTRINQILSDSKHVFNDGKIIKFIEQKKTIIYGSVEANDYDKIIEFINSRKDLKHIIVPHEITPIIIKNIKQKILSNYTLYSTIDQNSKIQANILIVDNFGILKYLYKYSHIAYVGGGFNNGIHNILEPVTHGNFVLFGPKYQKFEEAYWLLEKHMGKSILNKFEFMKTINEFLDKNQSKDKITQKILPFLKTKQQNLDTIIEKIKHNK